MAYAITNTNPVQHPLFTGPPVSPNTLADQTASSAATAIAPNARTFRARVYVKTYVVGSATVGPLLQLQVAPTSAFNTTTVITVDTKVLPNTATGASNGGYFVELFGSYPFVAGANYAKILVTLDGTASIAYDAELWSA